MAWRRDPATGEWEMVDAMTPDPMTQGMTGQESGPMAPPAPRAGLGPSHTEAGYTTGDDGVYPVLPAPWRPSRTAEGATEYQDAWMIPSADPDDPSGHYDNVDYDAVDRWAQEVQAHGNEVRTTAVGTFEVDSGGRIVSQMPDPAYRMN